MTQSLQHPFDYKAFFSEIKNKISETRINVSRQINVAANNLYWFIGKMIADNQEKHGWGTSIVQNLAYDLKQSFPDVRLGFSERNLWDMRRLYLEYKDHEKLRRFVAEIGWGANLVIMYKIKDYDAREYYLQATAQQGWTRDILSHQIKSQAYERHCFGDKSYNFHEVLPKHLAEQADKTLKSIYSLEMLGIGQNVTEAELENRIVEKIKYVMMELGKGFTFIGNQYRLVSPSGTESFIDLLFFNRILQSIVAIELKVGRFKPEYAGKMNYYLGLLDDLVKQEWENPSIGIILCTDKNHIDVEYALRDLNKPVGVSEYQLLKKLPSELSEMLPDPKQLEQEILKELGFNEDEQD